MGTAVPDPLIAPPDWTTLTRDRVWWLAATPVIALGFVVAETTLRIEGRLEFMILVACLVLLPLALTSGLRRSARMKPVNAAETWSLRAGVASAVVGAGWMTVFGGSIVPWWAIGVPVTVCQWVFIWLKAGPDKSTDAIARVFD